MMARRQAGGFTLIEIVAAFFVFALAFTLLIGLAADGLRKIRRAADATQAALHAQSKLDALAVAEPMQEGGSNGRFDDRFRYDLQVRKEQPPLAANGLKDELPIELYRIDLTVHWGERGREREARYSTLRAVVPDQNAAVPQ